jgi:acetyl esterase/lipase
VIGRLAALLALPVLAAGCASADRGDADDVVPQLQAEAMARALTALGHPPRLTIYPGVGHDSWDRAYAGEQLPKWLLAHRRRSH